jgi:hypothetical protein
LQEKVVKMVIETKNTREYISSILDVMSLGISPECILQAPEKRFLIELIYMKWLGDSISDSASVYKLNEVFNWKKGSRHVYKYRNILKSKGWLQKVRGEFVLPPALSSKVPDSINMEITLINLKVSSDAVGRQNNRSGGEVLQQVPDDAQYISSSP